MSQAHAQQVETQIRREYEALMLILDELFTGDMYCLKPKLYEVADHYTLSNKSPAGYLNAGGGYDVERMCYDMLSDGQFNFGRMTVIMAYLLVAPGIEDRHDAMRRVGAFLCARHGLLLTQMGGVARWIVYVRDVNFTPS